jgi:hypothetical protein
MDISKVIGSSDFGQSALHHQVSGPKFEESVSDDCYRTGTVDPSCAIEISSTRSADKVYPSARASSVPVEPLLTMAMNIVPRTVNVRAATVRSFIVPSINGIEVDA